MKFVELRLIKMHANVLINPEKIVSVLLHGGCTKVMVDTTLLYEVVETPKEVQDKIAALYAFKVQS